MIRGFDSGGDYSVVRAFPWQLHILACVRVHSLRNSREPRMFG